MNDLEEMLHYANFMNAVNHKVFYRGLFLQTVGDSLDISSIVTAEDNDISRLFLQEGIDVYSITERPQKSSQLGPSYRLYPSYHFDSVQKTYPGSFSEEMDSPERTNALELVQLDPIDGTGDLKFFADKGKPYGATNLASKLKRPSIQHRFKPVAGMIFDFVDGIVILGDSETVEIYRVDEANMEKVPYRVKQRPYRPGQPIRIGKRFAYPHEGFDEFLKYLRDEKKRELIIVPTGGAGRAAEQLFRANMDVPKTAVPEDWDDTAIDVFFNCQTDHKTWDLDPVLAIYRKLGASEPTDVYGNRLRANAAYAKLTPDAWHLNGYLYSARGSNLHQLMAQFARDFERDTGYFVLDKALLSN